MNTPVRGSLTDASDFDFPRPPSYLSHAQVRLAIVEKVVDSFKVHFEKGHRDSELGSPVYGCLCKKMVGAE